MLRVISIGLISLLPSWVMSQVSTTVKSSGKGSYFYEEHHPTKFDASSFTFCGGRNSKSETANDKNEEEVFTSNKGNKTFFNNISTNKTRLKQFLNQQIEWDNFYDDKDYSFHVKFKKKVGAGQTLTQRNTCNTRTWKYRVDTAKSEVNTSVKIVVPENVWVVQIKKIVNKNIPIEVRYKAKKVYQKAVAQNTLVQSEGAELDKDIKYFFVKPGDEIQLETSFVDIKTNFELIADFKVTFVGHNRCKSIIKQAMTEGDKSDKAIILSQDIIESKLSGAFAINKDGSFPQKTHNSLLFLGCLTSKPQVESLLFENNFKQMEVLLDGIEKFYEKASRKMIQSTNETKDVSIIPFLRVVDIMTRYSLATSTLSAMKPMCDMYPYVVNGKKVGHITAYLLARQKLDLIKELLNTSDKSKTPQFASYFDEFSNELSKLPKMTYAELYNKSQELLEPLIIDYEANNKFQVVVELLSLADSLPPFRKNRQLAEFYQSLSEVKKDVYTYNKEVNYQVDRIVSQGNDAIDFNELRSLSKKQLSSSRELVIKFTSLYDLFDGEYANAFAEALDDINEEHRVVTKKWLGNKYGGFFSKYAGLYSKENNISKDEFSKLSECLTEPIRGLK